MATGSQTDSPPIIFAKGGCRESLYYGPNGTDFTLYHNPYNLAPDGLLGKTKAQDCSWALMNPTGEKGLPTYNIPSVLSEVEEEDEEEHASQAVEAVKLGGFSEEDRSIFSWLPKSSTLIFNQDIGKKPSRISKLFHEGWVKVSDDRKQVSCKVPGCVYKSYKNGKLLKKKAWEHFRNSHPDVISGL